MQRSLHGIIFWLTYFFAKTNQGQKINIGLVWSGRHWQFYFKAKRGRCFNTTLVDCPTRWSLLYWYLDIWIWISMLIPKWPRNIVQQCANTTHTANCKLANISHIQPSGHFKTVFTKTTISVHIFLVLSVMLRPLCNWDRVTYSKEA